MPVNLNQMKEYNYIAKPVAAGVVIVKDSLCANVTATGMLTPFVVGDVANYNRVYVAMEDFDNTGGADGVITEDGGDRICRVYSSRTRAAVTFDAVADANKEALCYGLSADSFQVAAVGPAIGRILNVYSATRAEIEFI